VIAENDAGTCVVPLIGMLSIGGIHRFFKEGGPPFKRGVHYYFWYLKGGSTIKMRYFYLILENIFDEREWRVQPSKPPS
jgi:hypothetical protein